ncbi:MAG: D-alanine--D-alanine ligase [Planctomycetota bacterium]|nr:D-alanine--D-alanine ligase [Planctomycetota bacterium]
MDTPNPTTSSPKTPAAKTPVPKSPNPKTASLKIMVLAGGPDREHDVSLMSGATVTSGLAQAGHDVRQRDIRPDDLAALDEFASWGGDVVFPMLHGSWGEGGGLQRILEERGLRFVGCRAASAELCMDKTRAKLEFVKAGLPTPPFELLAAGDRRSVAPPLVVKAPTEGSSIDLVICRNHEQVRRARSRLHKRHTHLLLEKFVAGKELTIGVFPPPSPPATPDKVGGKGNGRAKPMSAEDARALPPIHIVPATEFYNYSAKYDRDDTQYLFDIDLPEAVLAECRRVSVEAARALGCRHLCRVDLIVDDEGQPWILEINTIPGFTSHSLFPKAAAHAGISLPRLLDHFARQALEG